MPPAAPPLTLAQLRDKRATEYPPDPIPTIIPGGGVSLIAGASGTGKTAFLAWWTTRFRDGLGIFGHPTHATPCQAILAIDRSWVQSTSKWFEVAGFSDILAYAPSDDPAFNPSDMRRKDRRLGVFKKHLEKLDAIHGGPLPPGSILYVDPLAPFLGGNLIDYDACSVACLELRTLCRERQITIIGTAHTAKLKADKKDRYQRVQDRILGSTALLGYTDTQMYLASPDETESDYYSFFWNPHHAPSRSFKMTRDPKTGLFIPYEEGPIPEEHQQIVDLLAGAASPVPLKTIEVALSLAPSTAHRYLQALVEDGRVRKAGHGLYTAAPVS